MQPDKVGAPVSGSREPSPCSTGLGPSGFDPGRYHIERYDRDSTRIHCAGGWVVAMIERLANGRHAICVADQRFTQRTFASPKQAFVWWNERQNAIAMETQRAETPSGSVAKP